MRIERVSTLDEAPLFGDYGGPTKFTIKYSVKQGGAKGGTQEALGDPLMVEN